MVDMENLPYNTKSLPQMLLGILSMTDCSDTLQWSDIILTYDYVTKLGLWPFLPIARGFNI